MARLTGALLPFALLAEAGSESKLPTPRHQPTDHMATTEHTINDALAALLRLTRATWRSGDAVRSENTGVLKGSSKRPDILIAESGVSPVVVETEVAPAALVEQEARDRLGLQLAISGKPILSAVAVRLPERLRELSGRILKEDLVKATDFDFAVLSGASSLDYQRWPAQGWLSGGVHELSLTIQSASLPESVIENAADWLVDGVTEAAGLLAEVANAHPEALQKISTALKQEDSEQTRRMAMTIVADAFLFHEMLSGAGGDLAGVRSLEELRGSAGALSRADVLREWRTILKVDYWPIFDIARRILEYIPAACARGVVEKLSTVASKLVENQLTRSHDLTGAVFQKLIADRKFLAAYYTMPASASLLAALAISPEQTSRGDDWKDASSIRKLRIADFACGTGTLLSNVYRLIRQLHELTGGDSAQLHAYMMAESLVGCDVMPAAAHLTASMLSGAHPTIKYSTSLIMTVPYGRQDDGSIALGSLDLLRAQRAFSVLAAVAKVAEGMGETTTDPWVKIPHKSFDLVIMNPPFTRATGHEASKIGVPVPMFAAFGSEKEEQRAMAKEAEKLLKGTSYHGNAGEASAFLVLAQRKLTFGGMLALVMPLSLMVGEAWQKSRQLLRRSFQKLVLVTIGAARDDATSFSADTGMGECLVVGERSEEGDSQAIFLVLNRRPATATEGREIARLLRTAASGNAIRRLEDGPVGGTPIRIGAESVGYALEAPLDDSGWRLSRIVDFSLAQVAHQLVAQERIWLPGVHEKDALPLRLKKASEVGKVGPYHMDINGKERPGGIVRGPFDISGAARTGVPTYPVIWSHSAEEERFILVLPDAEGRMRSGESRHEEEVIRERAKKVWASASHCHFNRDFRFNSQSTAFCYTESVSIGGRAWPSLSLRTSRHAKAMVLWGNSSLGLLLYWWWASKQHSGRGSIPISSLSEFPVLDVEKLTEEQLDRAQEIFAVFQDRPLRPMNELANDATRHELDRRVWTEVLGFDGAVTDAGAPLDLLRRKLGAEPSITGGKG